MIRRALAAALLATVVGALAGPAFAEEDSYQFCVGLSKKGGGSDNVCVDLGETVPR